MSQVETAATSPIQTLKRHVESFLRDFEWSWTSAVLFSMALLFFLLITSSVTHEIDVARWLIGDEVVSVSVYTPRPTSRAADGMQDGIDLINALAASPTTARYLAAKLDRFFVSELGPVNT